MALSVRIISLYNKNKKVRFDNIFLWIFKILLNLLFILKTTFWNYEHPKTFPGVMCGPTQNLGTIGSAVFTFIGYKKTKKQTNRHPDKQSIYIDILIVYLINIYFPHMTYFIFILYDFIVFYLVIHFFILWHICFRSYYIFIFYPKIYLLSILRCIYFLS